MNRIIFACIFVLFAISTIYACGDGGSKDDLSAWVVRAGGVGKDSAGDIFARTDGSSLVTGGFEGAATFGLGEANETDITSEDGISGFIAAYNQDGTFAEVDKIYGGLISPLPDGSYFLTSYFSATTTFGKGEQNETTLTPVGDADLVIARFNADKTLAWAIQAGGEFSSVLSSGISTTPDGAVLVAGSFHGGLVTLGSGEANETTLGPPSGNALFLALYESDGSLAWAIEGNNWPEQGSVYMGVSISAASGGSSVITGCFGGTIKFSHGHADEIPLTSSGEHDIFVVRYNADGSPSWAVQAGGAGYDCSNDISLLPDGSSVVTGYFEDASTFGKGEANETLLTPVGTQDIFVARFSQAGELEWVVSAGGGIDVLMGDAGYGVSTLDDGSSFVTGFTFGDAIFGEGEPGETTIEHEGVFVTRYDPDGMLDWAMTAATDDSQTPYFGSVSAIPDGSYLLTGRFSGTATFWQGQPNETTIESAGDSDIYVMRYGY